ncbi:MAG: OstA-like protein, partial [Bacteroidota bacterium]
MLPSQLLHNKLFLKSVRTYRQQIVTVSIHHTLSYGLILLMCSFGHLLYAQTPTISSDTIRSSKVTVDFSDVFEYIIDEDSTYQRLVGSVELRQDSIYMYCDSATIVNNTTVIAQGNVIIQQGDSTSIFSDSLFYDSENRQAQLFGNVALSDKGQQLFTEALRYDLNTKVATYDTGATLTNDSTQLTSKIGYFYLERNEAFFKDSVVVVDPQFTLRSDTMQFNTATQVVQFLGPTLIAADSSRIYCEDGYYDTQNKVATFTQHAQFVRGAQKATAEKIVYIGESSAYLLEGNARFEEEGRRATADLIRYEEKTDETILKGNARYQDATQDIVSDKIVYQSNTQRFRTTGRSRISDPPQIIEADTIQYESETGIGWASGEVVWQDTSEQLTIYAQRARYNKETDYFRATGGRPMLITVLDGDSLFLASDTLTAYRPSSQSDSVSVVDSLGQLASDSTAATIKTDTSRILVADHRVEIFKSDMQAVCDSLIYDTSDSVFLFYQQPVLWSDTSQFSADTIRMTLKNN